MTDQPRPMALKLHVTQWTKMTWSEMLARARVPYQIASININRLHITLSGLRRNNDYEVFSSMKVTGRVSQGWLDLDRTSPVFQSSYDNVRALFPSNWTPGDYLVDFAARCKSSIYRPPYDLGRAIRNLPSFVRETSLLEQCISSGLSVSVPTMAENVSKHADLYLTVSGHKFAVWSFINTEKSWRAVTSKLQSRGDDLEGTHLLAPVDLRHDVEDCDGWLLINDDYAHRLAKSAFNLEPLDSKRTSSLLRLEIDLSHRQFVILDGPTVNQIRRDRLA